MCKVAMQGGAAQMKVKDYLQKIKDNSGRILESIGDMVWVINPANDNFEKLMFRMKEFTAEILEPLKNKLSFCGRRCITCSTTQSGAAKGNLYDL